MNVVVEGDRIVDVGQSRLTSSRATRVVLARVLVYRVQPMTVPELLCLRLREKAPRSMRRPVCRPL
jgi:hypothetical protein